MNLLIAFSPFVAFALLERTLGITAGLWIAAGLAAAFIVRDWLSPRRRVKLLEVGTVLLFGSLAVWSSATGTTWSVLGVRLRVDLGLVLIVLASILVREPFTLQYAKELAPQSVWRSPHFLRMNMVLTAVWALAFAVMVAADFVMLYLPAVPLSVGIAITIAALAGAFAFTKWYARRALS